MNRRHLALAAGVVLVLIGLAVAVTVIRPSPALTFRCANVKPLGDGVSVSVEISNHTRKVFTAIPVRLERLEWEE